MSQDASIVIEEVSPHGAVEAFVEQDARVAYFYLRALDDDAGIELRLCWIRNLVEAPPGPEIEQMRSGLPPRLPREFCRHPYGAPPLRSEALEILWFPAGDGAALKENGEILAVIPPWSGRGGFHGYARDCKGSSLFAWDLEPALVTVSGRLTEAQRYWQSWSGPDNPWATHAQSWLRSLDASLGPHLRYFAIDGKEWPPKALVVFRLREATVLVTVGVALRLQPEVELQFEDPAPHRRFELAMALAPSTPEPIIERCASYISAQTNLPWLRLTFLAHHHTVPCDSLPAGVAGRQFPAVLLAKDPPGAPRLALPVIDGDPVNLLWMIPITEAEHRVAIEEGSEHLVEALFNESGAWCVGMR